MQSNEFRVLFISILTLSDTEHFTIDRKTWEVSVFKVECSWNVQRNVGI